MKTILFLILATIPALARIGETPEQCIARYGEPVLTEPGRLGFVKAGFIIVAQFHKGVADALMVTSEKKDSLGRTAPMSDVEIETVLKANGSGQEWIKTKDIFDREWDTKDGQVLAHYNQLNKGLTIMTKAHVMRSNAEKAAEDKKNLEGF